MTESYSKSQAYSLKVPGPANTLTHARTHTVHTHTQ